MTCFDALPRGRNLGPIFCQWDSEQEGYVFSFLAFNKKVYFFSELMILSCIFKRFSRTSAYFSKF